MKQRMTALILSLALSLGLLTTGASAAGFSRGKTYTPGQFTDVAANVWYATSVKDCYELGLMNGSSATTFNPSGMFTLAEAATIAARMHNLYTGGNGVLPAASGAWYQSAVDYCVKNNIFATGDFNSYTRPATRAEMAAIMAAALPDSAWTAKNQVTELPDVTAVTPGSEAIFKLYNAGVFTGSDAYGKFQPYANITRAEVAAIVARCADETQRKTLNLTPLSQLEAPVIPGGYYSGDIIKEIEDWYYGNIMSNGYLKFKDPSTGKYGYLDSSGNIALPAIYSEAYRFLGGYAKVKIDGKWGLIDTNGVVTVPLASADYDSLMWNGSFGTVRMRIGRQEDNTAKCELIVNGKVVASRETKRSGIGACGFGSNAYYRDEGAGKVGANAFWIWEEGDGKYKYGIVNAAGQEISPIQYSYVKGHELYTAGVTEDNRMDVFDQNGTLLYSVAGVTGVEFVAGSRLFKVKEGNKYALYTGTGRVTEAIYDDIELVQNSQLAFAGYGNSWGVAGLNGEIFAPGDCSYVAIDGDYINCIMGENSYIADNTGILFQLEEKAKIDYIGETYCLGKDDIYSHPVVFDRNGKKISLDLGDEVQTTVSDYIYGKCAVVQYRFYSYDTHGYNYYFDIEGHRYGPYIDMVNKSSAYAGKNADGTWDYFNTDGEHGTGYATGNAALGAGLSKDYSVQKNAMGKPYVGYGNKWGGYTPVIEFYKNNMYYDEIQYLGEGYYACRFNTTWYLRHV